MIDGPDIGRHRIDVRRLQVAIHSRRHRHVVQNRPLQLLDAAVAPNEHTGGQVVPVRCSLCILAVTDAALSVRGFAVENAIAMQDLLPGKSGRYRQGIGRRPYLVSVNAEGRGNELEFLLRRVGP